MNAVSHSERFFSCTRKSDQLYYAILLALESCSWPMDKSSVNRIVLTDDKATAATTGARVPFTSVFFLKLFIRSLDAVLNKVQSFLPFYIHVIGAKRPHEQQAVLPRLLYSAKHLQYCAI